MCTVSWLRTQDGYQLLCNRDERHTRKPAFPPLIQEQQGVRFVAPVDGNLGGSWIGVNELGVTLCLLNRYGGSCGVRGTGPHRSRGLLLLEMLDSHSVAQIQSRIGQLDLGIYQPFSLVALELAAPSLLIHWNGQNCFIAGDEEDVMPLTSSSFETESVVAYRKRLLEKLAAERGGIDCNLLNAFHASHAAASGAYSPCMHREDASTVSFSRVKVSGEIIEFEYHPYAPCLAAICKPAATSIAIMPSPIMASM